MSDTFDSQETMDAIQLLLNHADPYLALSIHPLKETVTEELIHEKAKVLETFIFMCFAEDQAQMERQFATRNVHFKGDPALFNAFLVRTGEVYRQQVQMLDRVSEKREAALRKLNQRLSIEDNAAILKDWTRILGVKSTYQWSIWLVAVFFGLFGALTAAMADSVVKGSPYLQAVVATTFNVLILGIFLTTLVIERRSLSLLASLQATLPIAVVHFCDAWGWLAPVRSNLTTQGNWLLVPFAGFIGGLLAVDLVRTVTRNSPNLSAGMALGLFNPAIKAVEPPRNSKRNLAYAIGGATAAATLGFAIWSTVKGSQDAAIASLSAARSGLSTERSQLASVLETTKSDATRLAAERDELHEHNQELMRKNQTLEASVARYTRENTELEAQKEQQSSRLEEANKQVQSLRESVDRWEKAANALGAQRFSPQGGTLARQLVGANRWKPKDRNVSLAFRADGTVIPRNEHDSFVRGSGTWTEVSSDEVHVRYSFPGKPELSLIIKPQDGRPTVMGTDLTQPLYSVGP